MNWKITGIKFLQAIATVVAGILVSSQEVIVDFVIRYIPEGLDPEGTIIAAVVAIIVAVSNVLKHIGKK